MMDKNVIKNYLYNLSYQLLAIIIPIITTPYVSRVLGANGIGTYSYTNSIVQYFILFGCIGLNLYGQREIAYVQHDQIKRNKVFVEIVLLRVVTVSLSLLLYFLSFVRGGNYQLIYLIMSLDIIASMIDISWFFQGIEDFKKIVIRNFIIKLIGVLLIFLFIKTSDDLILYVFCHSTTLVLGNLSMWIYIPKLVNKLSFKNLDIIRHIRPTIALFIPQIAISIYTILDKTMIGLLTNSNEEVAYYEQAQKIIKIVLTIVTSLSTVMMSRIANLFQKNDMEQVKSHIMSSAKFIFILAFPMTFGIMALSQNIVPWFFGDGYDKVIPNMMLISPIIVCISFSGLFGTQYLLAIGRQKEYTLSVIGGTIINFILNLILIPSLYSLGAAIATVLAELGVFLIQLYFVRENFNINEILKNNIKYIYSGLVMFITVFFLARYLKPTMISSFLITLIGICVYFFIDMFIFRDNDILVFLMNLLKRNS